MNFYIRQSFLLFTSTAIAICNVIDNYGCSCACVTVAILSCKHVKIHYAFTPLKRRLSNCPSQIFNVLKQHQSFFVEQNLLGISMYPATIFTFKVSSIFSVHLGPKTRNLGASKTMREKKFFWNIFTFFSCSCNATLTCKRLFRYVDTSILTSEKLLIRSFFLWRLWRCHGISRFAQFLQKGIFLGTLIVIFENVIPKGFTDEVWRISKFRFDG